jgi:hypothetical protein
MVTGVLMGVGFALATIAVKVAYQPKSFRIERSTVIAAPARAAFGFVNDFKRWALWSPFAKLDPAMEIHIEGPSEGVGAVYTWQGNKKAGAGKMVLELSEPDRLVGIALQFTRPMAASNRGEFRFEPAPGGTRVTWSMTGDHNFSGKLFAMVVDVDKMVGKDFEAGLASLKALAEAEAQGATSGKNLAS